MIAGIVVAVIGSLAFAVASVLQARGAEQVAARAAERDVRKVALARERLRGNRLHRPSVRSTIATMLTPTFLAGFVFDIIGFAATIAAARMIPLFLSQTIISARLVGTALLAMVVLKVHLTVRDWLVMVVILLSLALLAVAAGAEGTLNESWMHWAVLVAGPLLFGLGILVMRTLRRRIAAATGLIAGVIFGVMAIASRILNGVNPLDFGALLTDPALYALVFSGISGFYLFTVALQTGSVNGAAAALVVGQTVIPGAIGIAFLGDVTRAGWGPAAIVAFAAAVVGGVLLASSGAVTAVEKAESTNLPGGFGHR